MKIFYIIILYAFSRLIKSNSNKKNLIIGAFKKYNWEQLKPFFISLHKSNFRKCDCAMFVQDISQRTKDILETIGVYIYEIPEKYKNMKINNVRYKLYEEYLQNKFDSYNMVLHVDVRDTFFQKDIFQLYDNYSHKPFFAAFQEDEYIKNDDANKHWIKFFCGDEALEVAGEGRIICSGTILATVDKFIEFCHIVWEKIEETKGYDYLGEQGILNCYIYYHKLFKDCLIETDNHGPVMTLAIAKRENIFLDKDDNMLNYDGKITCVAHQYDRMLDITIKFNKKFDDTNLNINDYVNKNNNNNLNNARKKSKIKNIYLSIIIVIIIISLILFFCLFIKKSNKTKNNFVKVKIKSSKFGYIKE